MFNDNIFFFLRFIGLVPVLVVGLIVWLIIRSVNKNVDENMRKFTIINFLIGVTVAIVLSVLLLLGLKIFIPAPSYNYGYTTLERCASNDQACYDRRDKAEQERSNQYNLARATYGGRIFVGANIAGLIILILGLLFFAKKWGTNIAAGMIVSGAFGIIYGYVLGWQGADDKLKFLVGVIVAAIVIGGGVMVNKMRDRAMTGGPTS